LVAKWQHNESARAGETTTSGNASRTAELEGFCCT
jgi:hypothetical protein